MSLIYPPSEVWFYSNRRGIQTGQSITSDPAELDGAGLARISQFPGGDRRQFLHVIEQPKFYSSFSPAAMPSALAEDVGPNGFGYATAPTNPQQ